MCENTLEFMLKGMFESELYQKLTSPNCKGLAEHHSESQNSELDLNLEQQSKCCNGFGSLRCFFSNNKFCFKADTNFKFKTKLDTDHSSSASKPQSISDSPSKDETAFSKMERLNKDTEEFGHVAWQFLSERFVPYLELLEHCKISNNQYGPIIRDTLEKYFADILKIDLSSLNKYWREQKLDKQNMTILQFALKLMYTLSRGSSKIDQSWRKTHKKELDSLRMLYERINMSIQTKQLSSDSNDENSKWIQSILSFYSFLFTDEENANSVKELITDSNVPALNCARSIISFSQVSDVIDTQIDKISQSLENDLTLNRKRSFPASSVQSSQDQAELIRSIRRKRSNRSNVNFLAMDGCESPNVESMGPIDQRGNISNLGAYMNKTKLDQPRNYSSQQDALMLKNKLSASKYILNTHKKQEKSKILKYSPFKAREDSIKSKSKLRKNILSKKTSGSNSFLGTTLQQKAWMAIKKGNKQPHGSSRTKRPVGILGLISQASFAKINAKEVVESDLQVCEEMSEPLTSQTPRNSSLKQVDAVMNDDSILQERDSNLAEANSTDRALVYNTPTKSNRESQEIQNNEFDF